MVCKAAEPMGPARSPSRAHDIDGQKFPAGQYDNAAQASSKCLARRGSLPHMEPGNGVSGCLPDLGRVVDDINGIRTSM